MGSRLRGEDALRYAEKMGVSVLMSNVLLVSATKAREMIDKASIFDRAEMLADTSVEIKEPARRWRAA